MDLLTHTLLTRKLIGTQPSLNQAAIGPDLPFYLTYTVFCRDIWRYKIAQTFTMIYEN